MLPGVDFQVSVSEFLREGLETVVLYEMWGRESTNKLRGCYIKYPIDQ